MFAIPGGGVLSSWRCGGERSGLGSQKGIAGDPSGMLSLHLYQEEPLRAWRRGGLDPVWGSSSVTGCRTIRGASAEQGMEEGDEEMGDEGGRQRAGRRRTEGGGCAWEDHSLCAGGLHLDAHRPSPVQGWDGHAVSELV